MINFKLESILREKCGLCDPCVQIYLGSGSTYGKDDRNPSEENGDDNDDNKRKPTNSSCPLCLDLLSKYDDVIKPQLISKLNEKIRPYASTNGKSDDDNAATNNNNTQPHTSSNITTPNSISKDSPTIVLPNIILVIAHCINCVIEESINQKITKAKGNDDNNDNNNNNDNNDKLPLQYKTKKVIDVYNAIKDSLRAKTRKLILDINQQNNEKNSNHESINLQQHQPNQQQHKVQHKEVHIYSKSQHEEEAGYLKFHIIFTPPLSFPYLPFIPSSSTTTTNSRKGSIFTLPPLSTKRERKRFRGNDPVAKQGGDPRSNLYSFVKMSLSSIVTNYNDNEEEETNKGHTQKLILEGNTHCCFLEKNVIVKHLDTIGSRSYVKKQLSQWFLDKISSSSSTSTFQKEVISSSSSLSSSSTQMTQKIQHPEIENVGIYISCWRNHFYLKGKYTKSRRDVSQTPFYVSVDENDLKSNPKVNDDDDGDKGNQPPQRIDHDKSSNHNNKRMKKLGITSVEEEICPIISKACHGIATENNEQRIENGSGGGGGSKNNLVYGMCKFHASGREDMDVRMILPESTKKDLNNMDNNNQKNMIGSGRPFVCEVIDAYKLPSIQDLTHAVKFINQNGNANDDGYNESSALEEITLPSDGKWVNESPRKHVQYGINPRGVGISGLSYCHSSSFSNLQSETEDKVKFYGCLCWSYEVIPNQTFLEEKLINCGTEGANIYPLRIEQSTPLRVLHRRSAGSRTRYVLTLQAKRIDDHFFRLHLSTSAGAYVKEFCHGDCGRTKPSISSLLGCKTDILELDCEGIAVS